MWRFACLLTFVLAGATGSAVENAVKVEPALELRVRAASDALDVFDYLLNLVPNDPQVQQYLKMAKTFGESKKGFLGLDPTKPIGAYVGIANEVSDSPVVLMVPVAVEADFISLLKTYLKLDPKKVEEGLYSFAIPNIPAGPGYFRFAHGYAYVTIRSAKSIDANRIIPPMGFFTEKHPDILNAKVRIDRFPADIRKAILGQLELGWHETIAGALGTPLELSALKCLVGVGADMVKTIFEDGQSLDFSLKITPKTDDIALNLTLTPRAGTGLAKFLKEEGTRPSRAASMFTDATAQTAMTTVLNVNLPPQTRKKVGRLADTLLPEWAEDKTDEGKEEIAKLRKLLEPMLDAGEIQFGQRVDYDPGEKKAWTGMAMEVRNGDKLADMGVEAAKTYGIPFLKPDPDRTEKVRWHEWKVIARENLFGTDAVSVATSETLWAVANTPNDLKKAFARKPKPAPMLLFEMYGSHIPGKEAEIEKYLGKNVSFGDDRVGISLTVGNELKFELSLKGRVLEFYKQLGRAREQQ